MLRIISLFIIACLAWPALAHSADSDFQQQIAANQRAFGLLRANLQQAAAFARSRPELFNPLRQKKNDLLAREDKLAIWNSWSSVLDSIAGLDAIRREHKKFDLFHDKERRNTSFAIANASFLAGYRYALEFIALADNNPALDTVLNEPVPELGIPAGTFDRFKFRFLNVAIASEFAAMQVIAKSYGAGPRELHAAISEDSRVIWKMGKGKGHELTLKNALAVVQKTGFTAWFPLQKGVSSWMGDTKVARKHSHLISARQIAEMGKRLQPGDILFERHEWYLSNLGLPGF